MQEKWREVGGYAQERWRGCSSPLQSGGREKEKEQTGQLLYVTQGTDNLFIYSAFCIAIVYLISLIHSLENDKTFQKEEGAEMKV